MNDEIKVLDHGYVKKITVWGSDQEIIESARMSTDKGFLGWGPFCSKCGIAMVRVFDGGMSPADYERAEQKGCDHNAEKPGDEKLLRFLYEKKHSTPFEMAGMTIEVQAPIFVFREWHRHRTQSYSEMSARYTPLPDLNYIPSVERLLINSKTNKQAGTIKGAEELDEAGALEFQSELKYQYAQQEDFYQRSLKRGVPKELARIHLPVGRYSKMRASTDLRNWLAFCTLRMAPDAQYEIRVYADAVGEFIKKMFPRTWELFVEDRSINDDIMDEIKAIEDAHVDEVYFKR
jgi:thymidylate synthase (FAD)